MKAVILAAGKGTRISEKIDEIPKSTLKLADGTPILRRSVENMISAGLEPVICVGYKKELVFKALRGLQVKYYYNPFYSITNNIVSLWFAREVFCGDDVLLSSADLYYPKSFLQRMIDADGSIVMAVDSSRIDNGDFYFSIRDGLITEYGPDVPFEKRTFEYMGLSKVSSGLCEKIKKRIEEYIENEMFDNYFEDMLINFNEQDKINVNFVDVAGNFWREFDFYEDYLDILNYEKGICENGSKS